MQTNPNSELSPEDDLKADNQILKLKLELEHGMISGDMPELSPELENKWLTTIYDFENQYRREKPVKVFDLLGKPDFPIASTLSDEEIEQQMARLSHLMEEKRISLDCLCQYDDRVIYQFITEELFDKETDIVFIDGMVLHYTYEEFYPNHEYDLKRYAHDLIASILRGTWNKQFDIFRLSKTITFNGKEYTQDAFSSLIHDFQQSYLSFELKENEIKTVAFDLATSKGNVQYLASYQARTSDGEVLLFSGLCPFDFIYDKEWGDWEIRSFNFPGFADSPV